MRKLTFRSIFICIALLLTANLCVNLFTGAASSTHQELDTDGVVRTYSPPVEHDGNCICDGLDPNCKLTPEVHDKSYDDEMRENMRDFQLDMQYNGDIIIYANEVDGSTYVGVYHHGTKCNIKQIIDDYIEAND